MKEEQNSKQTQETETAEPYKIYINNIYSYIDDFIDAEYKGFTDEELKKDKGFFPRLIQYLYNSYIGDLLNNKTKVRNKIMYDDLELLDNLFFLYIDLVYKYKYNNRPSLLEYSIFININYDTLMDWKKGKEDSYIYNTNNGLVNNKGKEDKRRYVTLDYCDKVKKWSRICEQSLIDGSGEMVKEIFLLKALYNYQDSNSTVTLNIEDNRPLLSADVLPALLGQNGNN